MINKYLAAFNVKKHLLFTIFHGKIIFVRKGGKSEALNNMVNRKRTQASNLKKTRNRQRITNVLMTSLILGGTLIPITAVLADGIESNIEIPNSETITTTSETSVSSTTTSTVNAAISKDSLVESNQTVSTVESTQEVVPNDETNISSAEQGTLITTQETKQRTYHIGSDGFWYADDLEEHTGSNNFVDLDFTFIDNETGEVLATIKEDKYYYDIESGFFVDLGSIGIDTTRYGISLASQTLITNVHNPISVNGQPTEYYSLFVLLKNQFYNDGAGKMTLTIPLDKFSDAPTPPATIDEENRPILEQTITDAKPYLNKDKYQSQYVDALDQAIKAGEQALADNPQVQSRSLFANTSNGTVFEPHIGAINTALTDVKAHPVVPQDSTDDSTNTTDTSTSDSSSTNTADTTSPSSTNEGTDTSKETIKPVSTKQNTDTSTNKKDTLPQTGESVNPWVTVAGLVALASTTFAWFLKRKKA
ncbi:LPXTG cell wall anchor domain-containing protein [Enterococcus casseliflavus]|nr:LPXTG cell wall anchor domain-containing protein [Enterococcus casseliflavus]